MTFIHIAVIFSRARPGNKHCSSEVVKTVLRYVKLIVKPSTTAQDIRSNRIFSALSVRSLCEVVMKPTMRAALSTITKLRKDKSLEVNTSFKALLNSMPQEVLTSTRTD